jgi:hypothetical protein
MKITINGEIKELESGVTLDRLLELFSRAVAAGRR